MDFTRRFLKESSFASHVRSGSDDSWIVTRGPWDMNYATCRDGESFSEAWGWRQLVCKSHCTHCLRSCRWNKKGTRDVSRQDKERKFKSVSAPILISYPPTPKRSLYQFFYSKYWASFTIVYTSPPNLTFLSRDLISSNKLFSAPRHGAMSISRCNLSRLVVSVLWCGCLVFLHRAARQPRSHKLSVSRGSWPYTLSEGRCQWSAEWLGGITEGRKWIGR